MAGRKAAAGRDLRGGSSFWECRGESGAGERDDGRLRVNMILWGMVSVRIAMGERSFLKGTSNNLESGDMGGGLARGSGGESEGPIENIIRLLSLPSLPVLNRGSPAVRRSNIFCRALRRRRFGLPAGRRSIFSGLFGRVRVCFRGEPARCALPPFGALDLPLVSPRCVSPAWPRGLQVDCVSCSCADLTFRSLRVLGLG